MDKDAAENHKRYLERKALNKRFGYDVDQERAFVMEQAKPLYGRILEAGTGKGHFALCLAQEGRQFVTFDISPDEQNFAKLNLAYFGLERFADFRIENAEHTSFADKSFDVILSVNVLHHLQKPYQVIDELIRILAPKGKIVLADFTEEGFKIMDKIHGLDGNTHEVGKAGLTEAEAYFIKKGFLVKKAKSVNQCVLIAGRGSI
ncbi:MAG: class I SAM-dependent methyltransferase [Candidatus Omnitrophota bacterium]